MVFQCNMQNVDQVFWVFVADTIETPRPAPSFLYILSTDFIENFSALVSCVVSNIAHNMVTFLYFTLCLGMLIYKNQKFYFL